MAVVVAASCAVAACDDDVPGGQGRVIDLDSGRPIPGATVRVHLYRTRLDGSRGELAETPRVLTTGADGNYRVRRRTEPMGCLPVHASPGMKLPMVEVAASGYPSIWFDPYLFSGWSGVTLMASAGRSATIVVRGMLYNSSGDCRAEGGKLLHQVDWHGLDVNAHGLRQVIDRLAIAASRFGFTPRLKCYNVPDSSRQGLNGRATRPQSPDSATHRHVYIELRRGSCELDVDVTDATGSQLSWARLTAPERAACSAASE